IIASQVPRLCLADVLIVRHLWQHAQRHQFRKTPDEGYRRHKDHHQPGKGRVPTLRVFHRYQMFRGTSYCGPRLRNRKTPFRTEASTPTRLRMASNTEDSSSTMKLAGLPASNPY